MKKFIVIVIIILLLGVGTLFGIKILNKSNLKVENITGVVISINPKILIEISEKGKVNAIHKLNEDASIFDGIDITDITLTDLSSKIVKIAKENGYLNNGEKLSISSMKGSNEVYVNSIYNAMVVLNVNVSKESLTDLEENQIRNTIEIESWKKEDENIDALLEAKLEALKDEYPADEIKEIKKIIKNATLEEKRKVWYEIKDIPSNVEKDKKYYVIDNIGRKLYYCGDHYSENCEADAKMGSYMQDYELYTREYYSGNIDAVMPDPRNYEVYTDYTGVEFQFNVWVVEDDIYTFQRNLTREEMNQ